MDESQHLVRSFATAATSIHVFQTTFNNLDRNTCMLFVLKMESPVVEVSEQLTVETTVAE